MPMKRQLSVQIATLAASICALGAPALAHDLPIFDAHVHYRQ